MKNLKWKVQESKSGKSNYNIVGETFGDKYKIARVPFMSESEPIGILTYSKLRQEAFEHATLIAAAPDLLEALQNLLDDPNEQSFRGQARVAINKALTTQP